MIYSVWSYQNNGAVLWQKKKQKNSEEQVPRLPPGSPQPSTHPPAPPGPHPTFHPWSRKAFVCKFGSEQVYSVPGKLQQEVCLTVWRCCAAAHVHLCLGACPCVFEGGAVVCEGSTSSLTYHTMPLTLKSCCFYYRPQFVIQACGKWHHLPVFDGEMWTLSVSSMDVPWWFKTWGKAQRGQTVFTWCWMKQLFWLAF